MNTSQFSDKFYKRMYLALAASGGLSAINIFQLMRVHHADSMSKFTATVWILAFGIIGFMLWRWRTVNPIEISDTKIISRHGLYTKAINLSDVSSVIYENGVYRLLDAQNKEIRSFGDNEYKDLSFFRNLPQFNPSITKPIPSGESMKKVFVISFAISFGVVTALLAVAITLLATGVVKRSLFGGYSLSFEDRKSESGASEYDRKSAIAKGLIVKSASVVDGDDDRLKKIICEMTNPNDGLTEELVSFDIMLLKQGKVFKILSTVETISLKKGETKRIIMDLIMKEKLEFDSIEMIAKG